MLNLQMVASVGDKKPQVCQQLSVCLVYGKYDAYAAQGKNDITTGLLKGELNWEEDKDKLLEIIYRCPVCAACDINCKRIMDLDIIGVLDALREEACEKGYGPLPAHKEFIQSIMNYDNVWKQPRTRRANWAKKLDIKDLSKAGETADVLYYVGCTYAYKPGMETVPRQPQKSSKQPALISAFSAPRKSAAAVLPTMSATRRASRKLP